MTDSSTRTHIAFLLNNGLTLAAVGKLVGLSTSRVFQIKDELRGKRRERRDRRGRSRPDGSAAAKMVGGVMPMGWAEIMSRAVRCGGCGGKVVMPCRLCRVRGEAEQGVQNES